MSDYSKMTKEQLVGLHKTRDIQELKDERKHITSALNSIHFELHESTRTEYLERRNKIYKELEMLEKAKA